VKSKKRKRGTKILHGVVKCKLEGYFLFVAVVVVVIAVVVVVVVVRVVVL